MTDTHQDAVRRYFAESRDALQAALEDPAFLPKLLDVAGAIRACLAQGGRVLLAGNGGSAADAQHFATELLVRFDRERRAFAAIALTTDGPVITAAGNDFGFNSVFARQVEGLGRPRDVFLALSTSGRSKNLLVAADTARRMGLVTIAFCASGGPLAERCDIALRVPCTATPLIQQVHMVAAHAICALLEVVVA